MSLRQARVDSGAALTLRQQVASLLHQPGRAEVLDYIRQTVLPALTRVADELRRSGLDVAVESPEDGRAGLDVRHGDEIDFYLGACTPRSRRRHAGLTGGLSRCPGPSRKSAAIVIRAVSSEHHRLRDTAESTLGDEGARTCCSAVRGVTDVTVPSRGRSSRASGNYTVERGDTRRWSAMFQGNRDQLHSPEPIRPAPDWY